MILVKTMSMTDTSEWPVRSEAREIAEEIQVFFKCSPETVMLAGMGHRVSIVKLGPRMATSVNQIEILAEPSEEITVSRADLSTIFSTLAVSSVKKSVDGF